MSDGAGQSGVNNKPQESWRTRHRQPQDQTLPSTENRVDWFDWDRAGKRSFSWNFDIKAIFQVYLQRIKHCLRSSQQAVNLLYFLSVPPSHRYRNAIHARRGSVGLYM